MTSIDMSNEELILIKNLLEREAAETRIELHHSRHIMEFRNALKTREDEINNVLERVKGKIGSAK